MWQLADGRTCGQTGYIIWGAQCKMKMQAPCSKHVKKFKAVTAGHLTKDPSESRALCNYMGPRPGSWPCPRDIWGGSNPVPVKRLRPFHCNFHYCAEGYPPLPRTAAGIVTAGPCHSRWPVRGSIKDQLFSTSFCPVFISCHAYST